MDHADAPPASGHLTGPMTKMVNKTTAFQVEPNRRLLWEKPDSTWSWKLVALDRRLDWPNQPAHAAVRSPASAISALVLPEFGDFAMIQGFQGDRI